MRRKAAYARISAVSSDSDRFTLRFSKKNPEQLKAYQILLSIPPGKRTEFICRAMNQHTLNHELDDIVYRAVKRALNDVPCIRQERQNDDEIRDDIMNFLKGL